MGKPIIVPYANSRTYRVSVTGGDLDGYDVEFMVKKKLKDEDADAVITKSAVLSEGEATIQLTPEDTAITVDNYFYDVKVIDGSNYAVSSEVGQFIIRDVVNE